MTEPNNDGRHLVVVSILVSTIVLLVMSIALGIVGNKAFTAGRDAKAAAQANTVLLAQMAAADRSACAASNKTRAEVVDVWEFIFTLNPNPDPVAKERIDKARAKIAATYAERPCPP